MNQNEYQQSTGGYGQTSGMTQGGYPGGNGWPGYQAPQGYQNPQGSMGQTPQGYPTAQGYPNTTAAQQTQSYQTPQVTGSQKPAGSYPPPSASYTGQGSFARNSYARPNQSYVPPQTGQSESYAQGQGYSQPYYSQPQGYSQQPYGQPQGYGQQPAAGGNIGYTYPGAQAPGSSYIPQTPYSQGYTAPGYQAPAGYAQGYNAYNQMGRAPQQPQNQQPVNMQPDYGGQMPLNGGGYVPQQVPVKRRPFVMKDADLLILSAILLILFALGMFVASMSLLKWVFLALAAGTIALIWIKPLTATNKRLCYTIVFALLAAVTVVSLVSGSGKGNGAGGNPGSSVPGTSSSSQVQAASTEAPVREVTPEAAAATETPAPENENSVTERLQTFFYYWSANRQDDMLTLCSPSWRNKVENPKTALFGLMANRTPKDYSVENISGTDYDTSRTVTVTSLMDRNNGKDPVRYRLSVIMTQEGEQWYVDPQSLQTYEAADTPDPSVTETPGPTDPPAIYPNTVLYYNPSGGEYYHLDQNCKRINERYLPLKGHFTYAELSKSEYSNLKPCAICGAPSREE